jgi:hypothetical protein
MQLAGNFPEPGNAPELMFVPEVGTAPFGESSPVLVCPFAHELSDDLLPHYIAHHHRVLSSRWATESEEA